MCKSLFFPTLLCGLFLLPFPSQAQQHSSHPLLLVANQDDRALSIIDPAAGKQLAEVPEGGVTGHEVAASPDGRLAYVPIYGNSGVGKPGTDGRYMDVIDLRQRKVVAHVDFGRGVRPHCVIYDRHSGMLYVTNEIVEAVAIVDPHSLKVVGAIPTSQPQSHMLAISHDGSRGYTANVGPGTVSVLDMKARKTLAVIPVSKQIQRISVSRDDRWVFTSDQTKPQLAVIDASTNKIKTWIPLPATGYGTASTKDGRWLLVALPSAHKVAVIDLNTWLVARTIDVPSDPQEILVRPDGRVAYVSCAPTAQVAAIDLTDWKVESVIRAGKWADGLAWAGK